MAKVLIGGNEVTVSTLNFRSLKRVYPLIGKASDDDGGNPITSMENAIHIVAIGLAAMEDPKVPEELVNAKSEWIEETLLAPEVNGLQAGISAIMEEAGLIPKGNKPGEAQGAAPSTEIGTDSSQNLSPQGVLPEIGIQ